jgi:hypothetical protein
MWGGTGRSDGRLTIQVVFMFPAGHKKAWQHWNGRNNADIIQLEIDVSRCFRSGCAVMKVTPGYSLLLAAVSAKAMRNWAAWLSFLRRPLPNYRIPPQFSVPCCPAD